MKTLKLAIYLSLASEYNTGTAPLYQSDAAPLPIHIAKKEQSVMAKANLTNHLAGLNHRFLLAEEWERVIDPTGYLMSEKCDGVRAYWDGEHFWSRNGNVFHAPAWFTRTLPDAPLDGELWGGRGNFARSMGIARRKDGGSAWMLLEYVVFDAPDVGGSFTERLHELHKIMPRRLTHARRADYRECEGVSDLLGMFTRVQAAGGEGVMLRDANAIHRGGRSYDLMKVKNIDQFNAPG